MSFLMRIFLLLEALGKYDNYVPLVYLGPMRILMKSRRFRALRIKIWTQVCKKYEPFLPFYSPLERDRRLPQIENQYIREFYENGSVALSNVMSSEAQEKINAIVTSLKYDRDSPVNYHQIDLKPVAPELCNELLITLTPFYEQLFPRVDIRSRFEEYGCVQLRVDFSNDGKDQGVCTANWHPDRFVPTLNAIWFPEGADWGAFEKDIGDPIISERDEQAFLDYQELNSDDDDLRERAYFQLGRRKHRYSVAANTMVVGTHHIQHRRSPFRIPGRRIAVFIDHYNIFKMADLIS